MNYHGLTIGIWGTGIVATSGFKFFKKQGARLIVYDAAPLTPDKNFFFTSHHASIYPIDDLGSFLIASDYILPSAGINLKPYHEYSHKFLNEVDIFFEQYKNPTIAITGTIGKTTLTHAIARMLETYGYRIQIGGNIGIGLFDLLDNQSLYDYAVVELSSFQLEKAKKCAPDYAVWTNLYPNHLDRHGTMENYFQAKYALIKHQKDTQYALIHTSVKPYISNHVTTSKLIYFDSELSDRVKQLIGGNYKTHPNHYTVLYELAQIITGQTSKLTTFFNTLETPEHRVQHIATIQSVDFYDDSKATVVEATQGALARFLDKRVILFFGGVSKGVSREHFFCRLTPNIHHIYFFGKEASELHQFCKRASSITSSEYASLEEAFDASTRITQPNDVVLFSPGGASFDLFADYKERGKRFQELVKAHAQRSTNS